MPFLTFGSPSPSRPSLLLSLLPPGYSTFCLVNPLARSVGRAGWAAGRGQSDCEIAPVSNRDSTISRVRSRRDHTNATANKLLLSFFGFLKPTIPPLSRSCHVSRWMALRTAAVKPGASRAAKPSEARCRDVRRIWRRVWWSGKPLIIRQREREWKETHGCFSAAVQTNSSPHQFS